MKKILQFIIFLTFCSNAIAQEIPVNNHYFLNPYVYNPAYAGYNTYTVAFLNHRRQWMGIEGAPVSSAITLHSPLNKSIAVGFHVQTETRGLLTSSSAELGFAYRLNLSTNQYLKFGLSAGMGMSSTDLEELQSSNSNIPIGLIDNSMYLQGRFGIHYQLKNFNIGFSLPSLFERDFIGAESFNEISINPLENYAIMTSYKFSNVTKSFSFEPFLLYRGMGKDFRQLEATGVFNFNKIVWAGGSYRLDYGFTGLAGVKIKDFISIGYAYELSSAQVAGYTDGTHEINLSFKLGKERNFDRNKKVHRARFE